MQTREASVAELCVGPLQFLAQFQSFGESSAIICRIEELRHTSVIIVSPKLSLHCAVGIYPVFASALREYSCQSLVPDEFFFERFVRTFQRAGTERQHIPRALFGTYANYGAYGASSRLGPIGKHSPLGLALDRRVESSLVPDDKVGAVVSHWESQLRGFGGDAFAIMDVETDALTADPNSGIDGLGEQLKTKSGDYWALFANNFPTAESEVFAMERLRFLAYELAAGGSGRIDVFVGYWVKRAPSLFVPRTSDPNSWERLNLRTRVLRHLSKPWHYSAALNFLDALTDRVEDSDMLQASASNVRQYVAEIENRFPLVLENPIG